MNLSAPNCIWGGGASRATRRKFSEKCPCLHHNTTLVKQISMFETALVMTNVVVVYHVTIVAFGHGLLKKFWPFW